MASMLDRCKACGMEDEEGEGFYRDGACYGCVVLAGLEEAARQQRQAERAARWTRIEAAAVAILAGWRGDLRVDDAMDALGVAEALIAEIDRRRAAEEAGNG